MSHVANVEVEINDISALRSACEKLGLQFKEGQRHHRWYGKFVNAWHTPDAAVENGYDPETFGSCAHAIEVPGSEYDIGVVENPHGTGYRLLFDAFGREGRAIPKRLGGTGLTRLRTEYGATRATRHLQRKGYRAVRRVMTDGTVKLTGVQ